MDFSMEAIILSSNTNRDVSTYYWNLILAIYMCNTHRSMLLLIQQISLFCNGTQHDKIYGERIFKISKYILEYIRTNATTTRKLFF